MSFYLIKTQENQA